MFATITEDLVSNCPDAFFDDSQTRISSRSDNVKCDEDRLCSQGFMPHLSLRIVKIVPSFESRILAMSLKPIPLFHESKTNLFSAAVNVRFIQ